MSMKEWTQRRWLAPLKPENLTEEQQREVDEIISWVDRANCAHETGHGIRFHDDSFRFHTCTCEYLEVFYVRT